jgi:hypothetical protein
VSENVLEALVVGVDVAMSYHHIVSPYFKSVNHCCDILAPGMVISWPKA